MQIGQNRLNDIWELKQLQRKISFSRMLHLQKILVNASNLDARFALNGSNPCIGIEEEHCRIALGIQHPVPVEHIIAGPVLLHIKVSHGCYSNLLSCVLLFLHICQKCFTAILLLFLHPLVDLQSGSLHSLIQEVAELDSLSGPCFELLLVLPLHNSKSHMVAACQRWSVPASLLGSIKNHMKMLLLSQIGYVDDPVCPHHKQAMVDRSQVGGVVSKAAI
mmetsp:Transcript_32121/g.51693  ORF Transcript_32121/g.51693 Transcript_32121/m.51693 type:complete len:220 (+) Transcript_32121:411-1070(+)